MKLFKYALLALAATAATGCSDYLEVTDESSVSPDNFPSNIEHVDLLLNSTYAGSHGIGLYSYYWFPQIIYLLDKTHDTYGDYDDRSDLLNNAAMSDNARLAKAYSSIMEWIQYANAASDGADAYRPSVKQSEVARLDYMKGQALFNRALAYWHAQIFFELESKEGALGFPIIEHVPEGIADMTPPRATVKETWDFVISTLNEASELLKGNNSDKTRATYWAARGLLAKVYMQARRPAEAVPVLEDIFANSGAKLLDSDTYYKAFFADEKYEFNSENLYELDFSVNMKQNGPWGGFTTGSGMQMVFSPWPLNLNMRWTKTPAAGTDALTQTTGGWGNNYVHDANVARFGFPLGTAPGRVENPNYDDSEDRSINNFPWILDPDYAAKSQAVRDNKECDPRLFLGAAQPWFDTFHNSDGEEIWYDTSPERADLGYFSHHYFSPRKFTNLEGYESELNFSNGANIPLIRLADLYLLYAEAVKTTKPAEALEYVNKVHRRAYGYDPNSASPVDYASLTATTCAARGNAADILANDVIKYERWAELFAEGQWWFDIRRYEILENEMKVYKETRVGNLTYQERSYAQPVPLTEIERYNYTLQQNYNY